MPAKGAGMEGRMRRQGETTGVPTPTADSGNRRQKEKDRSSFYYIYIQTLQGMSLIAQARAPGRGGISQGGVDTEA